MTAKQRDHDDAEAVAARLVAFLEKRPLSPMEEAAADARLPADAHGPATRQ
ncbi:MAG: hypothetical protein ACJ79U_05240 [Myxococcales bacterium]